MEAREWTEHVSASASRCCVSFQHRGQLLCAIRGTTWLVRQSARRNTQQHGQAGARKEITQTPHEHWCARARSSFESAKQKQLLFFKTEASFDRLDMKARVAASGEMMKS